MILGRGNIETLADFEDTVKHPPVSDEDLAGYLVQKAPLSDYLRDGREKLKRLNTNEIA